MSGLGVDSDADTDAQTALHLHQTGKWTVETPSPSCSAPFVTESPLDEARTADVCRACWDHYGKCEY
jgi:hypothetical protein